MSRYDMTFFNTLPLRTGNQLIRKAFVEGEKDKAWDLWISKYVSTNMFKPFSEFFEEQTTPKEPVHRSAEDLLKDAQAIREKIEKGGG